MHELRIAARALEELAGDRRRDPLERELAGIAAAELRRLLLEVGWGRIA